MEKRKGNSKIKKSWNRVGKQSNTPSYAFFADTSPGNQNTNFPEDRELAINAERKPLCESLQHETDKEEQTRRRNRRTRERQLRTKVTKTRNQRLHKNDSRENYRETELVIDWGSAITILTQTSIETLNLLPMTKLSTKCHDFNKNVLKIGRKCFLSQKAITIKNKNR